MLLSGGLISACCRMPSIASKPRGGPFDLVQALWLVHREQPCPCRSYFAMVCSDWTVCSAVLHQQVGVIRVSAVPCLDFVEALDGFDSDRGSACVFSTFAHDPHRAAVAMFMTWAPQ